MGDDELATVRTLTAYREVITNLIQTHRGRVVDSPGDNILAEFASVVDAVQCATEIQREITARNAELSPHRQMAFRIGINVGDVLTENGRLYGDGVNIAARLEGLADAGGICISEAAYTQIKNKLALGYEYIGEQTVKNIAEPVRAYWVVMDATAAAVAGQVMRDQAQHDRDQTPVILSQSKDHQSRRAATAYRFWMVGSVSGLLLIVGTLVAIRYLTHPPLIPQRSSLVTQEVQPPLPLPDKPSIVVLPFVNLSEDPKQEYFSDGITEDLTSDLSQLSNLFVIARNSAFIYKGKAVKVQDVSRELGVRYVLEGSVRKADDQVRISAQLIDATTGSHQWAERYDRPLKDIFALQDEIVQKIVANLWVEVWEAELTRVRRIPTDNLTAYDSLLRGVEAFNRFTKEGNVQARQMYERAITLDPQYAGAYVSLGWTYYLEGVWRWSQDPRPWSRRWRWRKRPLPWMPPYPAPTRS
jgi:adenylate cyclase